MAIHSNWLVVDNDTQRFVLLRDLTHSEMLWVIGQRNVTVTRQPNPMVSNIPKRVATKINAILSGRMSFADTIGY